MCNPPVAAAADAAPAPVAVRNRRAKKSNRKVAEAAAKVEAEEPAPAAELRAAAPASAAEAPPAAEASAGVAAEGQDKKSRKGKKGKAKKVMTTEARVAVVAAGAKANPAASSAAQVAFKILEARQTSDEKKKKTKAEVKATRRQAAEAKAQKAEAEEEEKGEAEQGSRKRKTSAATAASDDKRQKGEDGTAAEAVLPAEEYRKAHEVTVGEDCPDPLQSFKEATPLLGPTLVAALRKVGYKAPTPIQAQAWPIALRGDDIVAVSKTGSGKTCGFLLPALLRISKKGGTAEQIRVTIGDDDRDPAKPSCLIIAPTRELVQQIHAEVEKFAAAAGARVVAVYGGVDKGPQVGECKKGADIVVATPGRLEDFMTGNPKRGLAPIISTEDVSYLVLDEADKMLDMGFEPDVRRIVARCKDTGTPEEALAGTARQTLFFTATWPKAVHRAAKAFTSKTAAQVRIGQIGGDGLSSNALVKQIVHVVEQDDKLAKLKEVLKANMKVGETALVFAMKKSTCDFLTKNLNWNPHGAEAPCCGWCKTIHGDKEQWEREEALGAFKAMTANPKNKTKAILVATDVAARGLDIPGVPLVVVYDYGCPKGGDGIESYVHRIGRTGRAGKEGRAVCFFGPEEAGARDLAEFLKKGDQEVPSELQELADAETGGKRGTKLGGKGGSKGKGKGKGKGKDKGKGKGKDKGKDKGKGKGKGKENRERGQQEKRSRSFF